MLDTCLHITWYLDLQNNFKIQGIMVRKDEYYYLHIM